MRYPGISTFEKPYIMQVILTVHDNPGLTKTELLRMEEGDERTKFLALNHLIKNGFVEIKDERKQHNAMRIYITPKGVQLAVFVALLNNFLIKEGVEE